MDTEADFSNVALDELIGSSSTDEDRDSFGLTVGEILYGNDLKSSIRLFREADIGLDLFLQLNEDDLEKLGMEDEKERQKLAKIIENLQNPASRNTASNKNILYSSAPEPKMSTRQVLLTLCHTGMQLNGISEMLENVEKKLKSGEFHNTSVDPDYCAAHALVLVCSHIEKQAHLLHSELTDMTKVLCQIPNRKAGRVKKSEKGFFRRVSPVVTIVPSAAIVLAGIYLWKRLRK